MYSKIKHLSVCLSVYLLPCSWSIKIKQLILNCQPPLDVDSWLLGSVVSVNTVGWLSVFYFSKKTKRMDFFQSFIHSCCCHYCQVVSNIRFNTINLLFFQNSLNLRAEETKNFFFYRKSKFHDVYFIVLLQFFV